MCAFFFLKFGLMSVVSVCFKIYMCIFAGCGSEYGSVSLSVIQMLQLNLVQGPSACRNQLKAPFWGCQWLFWRSRTLCLNTFRVHERKA